MLQIVAGFFNFGAMVMSERILRRMGRTDAGFGEAELAYVADVIAAYNEERAAGGKAVALPMRYVDIGGEIEVSGHRLRCIERPVRVWPPCEACSGCALSKLYLGCSDIQCSIFDRRDRKDVWFVENE